MQTALEQAVKKISVLNELTLLLSELIGDVPALSVYIAEYSSRGLEITVHVKDSLFEEKRGLCTHTEESISYSGTLKSLHKKGALARVEGGTLYMITCVNNPP